MKRFISSAGLKQSFISEKTGISKVKLNMILNGNRKCEAAEYVSLCKMLGVEMYEFMESKN